MKVMNIPQSGTALDTLSVATVTPDTGRQLDPADAPQDPQSLAMADLAAVWQVEYSRLMASVFRIVKRKQVAEDILAEAYVRLAPSALTLTNPAASLYTVTRNLAIDWIRARKPTVPVQLVEQQGQRWNGRILYSVTAHTDSLVEWVKSECTPQQRNMVSAWIDCHGYIPAISKALRCSDDTVWRLLRDLRESLQGKGRINEAKLRFGKWRSSGTGWGWQGHSAVWSLLDMLIQSGQTRFAYMPTRHDTPAPRGHWVTKRTPTAGTITVLTAGHGAIHVSLESGWTETREWVPC